MASGDCREMVAVDTSTGDATREHDILDRPPAVAADRAAVHRAVRDILPIAAAVVPFGTVVGVTLDVAGLVGLPALTATALVYAGSASASPPCSPARGCRPPCGHAWTWWVLTQW